MKWTKHTYPYISHFQFCLNSSSHFSPNILKKLDSETLSVAKEHRIMWELCLQKHAIAIYLTLMIV